MGKSVELGIENPSLIYSLIYLYGAECRAEGNFVEGLVG